MIGIATIIDATIMFSIDITNEKELKFNMTNLTLEYDNMRLHLDYDGKTVTEYHYIDDAEQSYPYKNTYDSPFMVSEWDSGVITVKVGKIVRTMDFMNVTDTKEKVK